MSIMKETIIEALEVFLDRYAPPRHMQVNENAMRAESEALAKLLLRFAPREDYSAWIERVLDEVSLQMKTRVWPTVGELAAVIHCLPRPAIVSQQELRLDPHEIAAKRMNAGEAVGESYVWGQNGDLLVKRGLVSGAVRGDYQRGSIRHHVNLYKHDTDRILRQKIGEASYARYAGFIASLVGQRQFDTG